MSLRRSRGTIYGPGNRAPKVRIGLDLIEERWPSDLKGARVGLLTNISSFDSCFRWAGYVLAASGRLSLKALFGPQHGLFLETQENMIEWEGSFHEELKVPIYSLYGRARKPSKDMLGAIDVFVFDLQDVGARPYTYVWTMDLCMEACEEEGKVFVVLDRPNPISGVVVEGPLLRPELASFVGRKPIPMRHGLTVGELAGWLRERYYPSLDLRVIAMEGYRRSMWFDETGLFWPLPSPNMPCLDTALLYPGMCLLEGTNMSEGRGTTRPFELFGAPFLEPERLLRRLKDFRLPGCVLRPVYFSPTFHKYKESLCAGLMIHVTERESFKPFKTAVCLMRALYELYPREFRWREPPYEYEYEKLPIDLLSGTDRIRREIEEGVDMEEMEAWWQREAEVFDREREAFLLYP